VAIYSKIQSGPIPGLEGIMKVAKETQEIVFAHST